MARRTFDLRSLYRDHPWLVVFNLAYLTAATAAVLWLGNTEFLFYLAAMVVILVAVMAIHRRVGFRGPVLWALSVWGIAHMAGGLLPLPEGWPHAGDQAVWYSGWIIPDVLKYDNVVHAFGFGTCVVVCHQAFSSLFGTQHFRHIGVLSMCVFAACGLGAANEIVEFIATLISPDTNVGGYRNTALDLVFNLIGATTVAGFRMAGWGDPAHTASDVDPAQ